MIHRGAFLLRDLTDRRTLMRNLLQKIQRFVRSDDGPTAVEYAVMIALIVLVCFASIQAVGTNTAPVFQRTAQSLGTAS
jgi:pilus assembly protein Flp/PilA